MTPESGTPEAGRAERDVVVTALPAPHVYGNVVINGTFLAGGTVVLMQRFSAAEALALIGEHRAVATTSTQPRSSGCWPGIPLSLVGVGPVPDPVKGELPCAYVVPRPGARVTEAELIDFTHDQLAAYKRPRRVVFLSSLPATSSGKIMRRKLAEAAAGQAQSLRPPPSGPGP